MTTIACSLRFCICLEGSPQLEEEGASGLGAVCIVGRRGSNAGRFLRGWVDGRVGGGEERSTLNCLASCPALRSNGCSDTRVRFGPHSSRDARRMLCTTTPGTVVACTARTGPASQRANHPHTADEESGGRATIHTTAQEQRSQTAGGRVSPLPTPPPPGGRERAGGWGASINDVR